MGDLFHDDVPSSDIVDVFAIMERAKWHTCCVLTKRPRRMHKLLSSWEIYEAPPNIWLGVSVEDQKATDERIPILLQAPAALRFVSVEPMLGPVDLECVNREGCWHTDALCRGDDAHIDWVICGGETGPGARPMHPDWARSLRDQCQAAGVPFFFKGWGDTILLPNGRDVSRLRGRKYRELDGRTWDEVPEVSPDRNLVC
jgi:protein gp37